MSVVTQLISADELLHMRDDGFRYELIRGELRKMAPAGGPHGRVASKAGWILMSHVEPQQLGVVFAAETGFRLAAKPDTVRAPDVAFVSRERIERVGVPEGYWPGAPDLAIEVISPGDAFSEVQEKVVEWLAAGSRMVIVLDPRKRTAAVYRGPAARLLSADDSLDGEEVVPGWVVPVKNFFD